MGVQFKAISNLEKYATKEERKITATLLHIPSQTKHIKIDAKSKFEANGFNRAESMESGWYCLTDKTEKTEFFSSSYGAYNDFRRHLAKGVIGVSPESVWEDTESFRYGPLYELINFADNEGIIGTEECKRIYDSLVLGRDKFMEYYDNFTEEWEKANPLNPEQKIISDNNKWIAKCYDKFVDGFGIGADNGIVYLS
jgi:hypothetical protein